MKWRVGREDHGFVDTNAMALNAAINGSIFAATPACPWARPGFGRTSAAGLPLNLEPLFGAPAQFGELFQQIFRIYQWVRFTRLARSQFNSSFHQSSSEGVVR